MLQKYNSLLEQLQVNYKNCSEGDFSPDYKEALDNLIDYDLSQEYIDFLCEIIVSKKHFWEFKFEHLRILILNKSAHNFDLKKFFLECYKKSRQLVMKLFFIRGYTLYATEDELKPLVLNYCKLLQNNHDYINYEYILSAGGLPYLVEKYHYECFEQALLTAHSEYMKISSLNRGIFTLNSNLEFVKLLSTAEIDERIKSVHSMLD